MSRKLNNWVGGLGIGALAWGLGMAIVVPSCGGKADPVAEARELASAGQYDPALDILLAQREASGLSAELGLMIGGVYELKQDPSAAVTIYRHTAEQFPGSGPVELRLGEIFLQLGQVQAGLDRLKLAREAGEPDKVVALSLSVAHGMLGQYEEAGAELDRAEAAGVAPSTVKYNRALLLSQAGQKVEARAELLAAHENDPKDASVLRELARVELELAGKSDLDGIARAEDYINRSISLIEESGRADWRGYDVLGDCFMARDDYVAASEMYLKAKEIGLEPDPRLDDKYYEAQVRLRALLQPEQE